ncbi:MAG: SCP2 sterol-binding domain-containing protein, partial [Nitrospirota bacterium]
LPDILRVYPRAKTVIAYALAMNRENVQSPSINIADEEYHRSCDDLAKVARTVIKRLNAFGVRGAYTTYAFPSDPQRWPGKIWDLSHKTMAHEAGIGLMGINRIVLHPKYGSAISLNSILIDTEVDSYSTPIRENPCIDCKLCVSVCPVGAISRDGDLTFLSCFSHNYRDTMAGFLDYIETIVASDGVQDFRRKFRDQESIAFWQSLTFGHAYKCSYCLAVCPAGTDLVKSYEADKKSYISGIVKPLRDKPEPVYVIKGRVAEKAALKNSAKEVRHVNTPIRPKLISEFAVGLGLLFDPGKAEGLALTLHFEFTGKEEALLTVVIAGQKIDVRKGHHGKPNLRIKADSESWIRFINEELSLPAALLSGKLRVKGNPLNMKKFKECVM